MLWVQIGDIGIGCYEVRSPWRWNTRTRGDALPSSNSKVTQFDLYREAISGEVPAEAGIRSERQWQYLNIGFERRRSEEICSLLTHSVLGISP